MNLDHLYPEMVVNRVYGLSRGRSYWERRLWLLDAWGLPLYLTALAVGIVLVAWTKSEAVARIAGFFLTAPIVMVIAVWQLPFVRLMSLKVWPHWVCAVILSCLGWIGIITAMVSAGTFLRRARVAVWRLGFEIGPGLTVAETGQRMERDFYDDEFDQWVIEFGDYLLEKEIPTKLSAFPNEALLYGYGMRMTPEAFLKHGYRGRARLEDFPNERQAAPDQEASQVVEAVRDAAVAERSVDERLSALKQLVDQGLVTGDVATAKQAEILKDL